MTSWLLSLYPDATQLWVPTQDHCSLLFWVLTTLSPIWPPHDHRISELEKDLRSDHLSPNRRKKRNQLHRIWIKRMWYIYTVEYCSAMKKNKITPFAATWMLEILLMSEVSQGGKNIIWHPLFVESKRRWYKWTYLEHIKRLTDLDKELMVSRVG